MNPKLFRHLFCLCALLTLLFAFAVQPSLADTTVGGTISADTTWTIGGSPYIVTSSIYIRGTDGADGITTLQIEPGVQIRVNNGCMILVGGSSGNPGALAAQGTAGSPITFTSNAATPAAGDWYGLWFYSTTDDAGTVMEHCTVEYGGLLNGSIYAYQASPTFRHVTVQHGKNHGAHINASEPVFENCTFVDNQNYDLYYMGSVGGAVTGSTINNGIYLLTTGLVQFSGNTVNQNNAFPIKTYADNVGGISSSTFNNVDAGSYLEISGNGWVTRDATWTARIPYHLLTGAIVQGTDGADGVTTLTIEPGAILKFNANLALAIGASSGNPGALIAQGTDDQNILFTSNKATPAAGDWYGIRFYNTADDTICALSYCVVEYAGYNTSGAVHLDNAVPSVSRCILRNSAYAGMFISASSPEITCNTFYGNMYGISCVMNSQPVIHQNNFISNTSAGVSNSSVPIIDAEDNWWNDAAGPNAGGDTTNGNVDADPWSTTQITCTTAGENHPPNTPATPIPANGAVRVAISLGTLTLQWAGGDPDVEDTLTYDLIFGQSPETLTTAAQDVVENQYTMTDLSEGATYYWQVVSRDNGGLESTGPVWSFTTNGDPSDLTVDHVATDPVGHLQSGQNVTFTAEVTNTGSGPVVDPYVVDFLIDGVSIGTAAVDQIIPAGGSVQVSQTWTCQSGDPAVSVMADAQQGVDETNEDNNLFSAQLSEIAR